MSDIASISVEAKGIVGAVKTTSQALDIIGLNLEKLNAGLVYVKNSWAYPGLPNAVEDFEQNIVDFNYRTLDFLSTDVTNGTDISEAGRTRLLGATSQTLNGLDYLSKTVPSSPWEDLLNAWIEGMRTVVVAVAEAGGSVLKFLSPILVPLAIAVAIFFIVKAKVLA
jgi:hypothetical protein